MGFHGVLRRFYGDLMGFTVVSWDCIGILRDMNGIAPSGNDQQVANWKIAHGNTSCSELKDGGSFQFAMSNI